MNNKSFNILGLKSRLIATLKTTLVQVGNDAVNFSLDRFKNQNWQGASAQPWQQRKATKRGNNGRAILVKTGTLRRSIRVTKITTDSVTIGSDVPYAKAHNEGFTGVANVKASTRHSYSKHKVNTGRVNKNGVAKLKTVSRISGSGQVKAHTRNMKLPRRQFMGESPVLTAKVRLRLETNIKTALKY
jgi:phage gpG-like protein